MRLMCPNCDAEYEVDASAIPLSGRDVQCSNCGHAWFQNHPDLEADQEVEAALYDPPPPLSKMGTQDSVLPSDLDWQVESDDPEAILDAMGREAREMGSDLAPNRATNPPAERAATEPAEAEPVPKHDLDPESLRILREEAEFETAQRALEQGRAASDAAPVVARRVARLKGIQPPPNLAPPNSAPPNTAANPSARLPKIETVSAALRHEDLLPPDTKRKSGRGGVFLMFFLALAATAAYIFSPDLSARFPSISQPLAQYVVFVDGLRDQLDIWLPKVMAQLQILLSQGIMLGEQGMTLGEQGIALVKGWF